MKSRVFILLGLIVLRLVMGLVIYGNYPNGSQLMVAGNILNVSQTTSNCNIVIGRFYVINSEKCMYKTGSKIRVIGSVNNRLIDIILGRIVLDSSTIDRLDDKEPMGISTGVKQNLLDNFREIIYKPIISNLPEPESGLVAGIVFGIKKDIGPIFYQEMVKSGTIHIAVASGYNVTVIGGTVLVLLFWVLKRKYATMVTIFVMTFYAILAGWEAPVIRALIMASLVFLGTAIGRKGTGWWSLTLAAWIMLMIDPQIITEVSFQLSVAASIGLFVVEPAITKWIESIGSSLIYIVIQAGVITTLAAMITTTPIIWWHFSRVSWIGIVSNILILPFVPLLMLFGVLMIVFSGLMTFPVYSVAHWIVVVIHFFGR